MRLATSIAAFVLSVIPALAQSPAPSYPPSTNWWMQRAACHPGVPGTGLSTEVRGQGGNNCATAVIHKNGNTFADAIDDHGPVGIPVGTDSVVAVSYAAQPCSLLFCYYKALLFGITQDGKVIIAAPVRESQDGQRRTESYAGNNSIIVREIDDGDAGRRYCFNGSDWFEGNDPNSCDMTHHSRITNLRNPGDPFLIVRDEFFDPPK